MGGVGVEGWERERERNEKNENDGFVYALLVLIIYLKDETVQTDLLPFVRKSDCHVK